MLYNIVWLLNNSLNKSLSPSRNNKAFHG